MMVTVLLITVFIDLITAVGVGMVIASFVFMKRMADLQLKNSQITTGVDDNQYLSAEESQILREAQGKIALYQLGGPLSFPAAKDMVKRLSTVDRYDVLVLDLTNVTGIDYTSCRAISDIIQNEQEEQKQVLLAGASVPIKKIMITQKALKELAETHIFSERLDALRHAKKYLSARSPNENRT